MMFSDNVTETVGTAANTAALIAGNVYEVRPRKDHRGVDLISDPLPLGQPWQLLT
jgi:hypothetical protein